MRARTRPGRLAVIDRYLRLHEPSLLGADHTVVDVGFGESPVTTMEWAAAIGATVIGVERDAARVEAARRDCPQLNVLQGDFSALASLGEVTVVRAMNVLRGGPVTETAEAHRALGAPVVNGGLVVEGSCDTDGQVTVAHLLRKRGGELHREGLLFHTTFERGFSPWLFRDWLPRDLRRTTTPGTPMFELLRLWHARFEQTAGALQNRFAQSLCELPHLTLWEPGGARWAPSGGVPRSNR